MDEAVDGFHDAVGNRLDDILEVRVGGVAWRRAGASPPKQGEWFPDLANGTFTLGASTSGTEVRCDARGPGFASFDMATADGVRRA